MESFSEMRESAEKMFYKSFTIEGNQNYKLPLPESMFVKKPWIIEELQNLKTLLNEVKSKLNCYPLSKWHKHTTNRNKAKDIEWRLRKEYDPELLTQAWCKFHEIISKYPLISKDLIIENNYEFSSLHLCEAPGAFITCLNHWLKTNLLATRWNWLATTLNPYYEGNKHCNMISDDRLIRHTLDNWFFGEDYTGNLLSCENLEALLKIYESKGKVSVVTADGSINCTNDPSEQELIVSPLHYCEVVAALHVLQTKGNFLLKIFTIFEHQSICLIYFLSCSFQTIHFYKPVTSKEGNSEVYVICLGFKGFEFILPHLKILKQQYGKTCSLPMFDKKDIPEHFIKQVISCASLFKKFQCEVIENNIKAYESNTGLNYYSIKTIAKIVADKYMINFPITKLHEALQVVGNTELKKWKSLFWVTQVTESYNEILYKRSLSPIKLLFYQAEKIPKLSNFDTISENLNFSFKGFHCNFIIKEGKQFTNILSSRFCTVQVAEIFEILFKIANEEKEIVLPNAKSLSRFVNEMQLDKQYKLVYFEFTKMYANNDVMSKLINIFCTLNVGDNLAFFGFLLLTQLNVGILFLLSDTFEDVEFGVNEQIGFYILFKNLTKNDYVLKNIQDIKEKLQVMDIKNKTVLSIVPITQIYDSEIYEYIEKINTWIAKFCIDYIASLNNKLFECTETEVVNTQ
ncbi:cap-specific mRNA (nucleoside-2'-O-)-methyltransferase 2 isoform X1 [Trichogramma pretiosum]|uniref:cap-specific mRNA (nucleoside-2'-O-)-methyltransferase 2 isoform X1 n=1 Tax=Trichogramma pretiosum TaxID=7493 RepID=UPI0006C9A712|nr:cap-specific mRNA (nucleoside-2'-O-)-methyltransferase 2 isoform X1 [Trichogramma pretiosum]XP_023319012.1 cap-specific mRNA (nucleoside-2'-O-)-methyltransferase 2 isoform X1 [Trichogramma pretiosum]